MVYICIEDETSGYDFITSIINNVICPSVPYFILPSLRGCENFKNLFVDYNGKLYIKLDVNSRIYTTLSYGDTVVLHIDNFSNYTESLAYKLIKYTNKYEVSFYTSTLYCFEQALFSYSRFGKEIRGLYNYTGVYKEFKDLLKNRGDSFEAYCSKYKYALKLKTRTSYREAYTLEYLANRVFYAYFANMPCVKINKSNYINFDACFNNFNTFLNAYYNNLCKTANLCNYCDARKKSLNCSIRRISVTDRFANLRHFYLHSDLYLPLRCIANSNNDKTLSDILR
jgi:hypothetical protein